GAAAWIGRPPPLRDLPRQRGAHGRRRRAVCLGRRSGARARDARKHGDLHDPEGPPRRADASALRLTAPGRCNPGMAPQSAGARTPRDSYDAARTVDSSRTLFAALRNARLYTASRRRLAPKVPTIVAPVGRSRRNEKETPAAETRVPMVHPMARRGPSRSAKSIAATEGTMRKQKTSSTPAMATEEVTTKQNES